MERYRSVINGSPAKHVLLKSIGVDVDFAKLKTAELWQLHNSRMNEYRNLDKNYRSITALPEPKSPSLLDVKIELAERIMEDCVLCPLRCQIDRNHREGPCRLGAKFQYNDEYVTALVQSILYLTHSITLSGFNIRTFLYKNWLGPNPTFKEGDPKRLAAGIDEESRSHIPGKKHKHWEDEPLKIYFTYGEPSLQLPGIFKILKYVTVNTAVIFDSNMFLTPEALRLQEGVVDLYAGEFSYGNNEHALRYAGAKSYWNTVTRAFIEAKKQAGVILYHVPLPGHLECCTKPIAEWCAKNLEKDTYVYVHTDYRNRGLNEFPELKTSLSPAEINRAYGIFHEAGFKNVHMYSW
jgi:putative pyruvate formate lyase activating enzyme